MFCSFAFFPNASKHKKKPRLFTNNSKEVAFADFDSSLLHLPAFWQTLATCCRVVGTINSLPCGIKCTKYSHCRHEASD